MLASAKIVCEWDPEAGVWFVAETGIPGLVTEAPTLAALRAKLPGMIQDLADPAGETDGPGLAEAF